MTQIVCPGQHIISDLRVAAAAIADVAMNIDTCTL